MTKPLQSASIAAPGFFGLNTQESGITLESGFALQATNCVIDKFGRLGARKGWTFLDESTGVGLQGMHRFVDIDATEYFGAWSDDTFYIYSGGSLTEVPYNPVTPASITSSSTTATVTNNSHGLTTGDVVTIMNADQEEYNGEYTITVVDANSFTYTFAGSATSPATGDDLLYYQKLSTEGNWQAVTLNDAAYLFQKNYEPLYFDTVTGTILDISASPSASGTPIEGNCALSAYGRVWTADTATNATTIYWTDLLDPTRWNSGTAGFLDLSSILVNGNDEIIALGAHNGFLIVFCKNNIIIFGDSDTAQTYLDPATLQLVEVINGVGCIARDSLQNTGTDILFLSDSGLMSLGRVIQEKSTPMRDLSRNVRDDLVQLIESETPANIKSAYSPTNAFYLLAFPTTKQVYCFDTRSPLQDGSARVTIWNNMEFTDWLGFDGEVYMTHADGLANYTGYQDNGQSYRMVYFTNYFDLGSASQTKILKRLSMTVIGATGQDFVVKSGFDYSDQYNSYPLTVRTGTVYEYNVANYGLTTTSAVSQGADTITDGLGDHYTVDFVTAETPVYNVPLHVWEDADSYYYTTDDVVYDTDPTSPTHGDILTPGTRTQVTLWTQSSDYITEYSGGTLVDTVRAPGSGSGSVLQLGFEADLNGGALSIQKMDVYVKQGRTI